MKTILPPSLTPIRFLNFAQFQALNSHIFLVINDRHLTRADIVSKMLDFAGRLHKEIRQGQNAHLNWRISMVFSWTLALTNRLHIRLDEEMWDRYSGMCPYCHGRPCLGNRCKIDTAVMSDPLSRPDSLWECQNMMKSIYPDNTAQKSAGHLLEEIVETNEALRNFSNHHGEELFQKVVVELVDVVANIIALANCVGINLAEEMEKIFSGGCPTCHLENCRCPYQPMEVK